MAHLASSQPLNQSYLAVRLARCILLSLTSMLGAAACRPQPEVFSPQVAQHATYLLPFPGGDSARLIQGNNGPWGHSGAAAFAFDFIMPIGSAVTATRGGHVFASESRYRDGNRRPGQENYVVIRHSDGTFGRYYHLTEGGVLVTVGAVVTPGDTIGRSGNTGASAGPHLHFDVTRDCAEWGCQTIPIRFWNAGADSLVQGRTYRALHSAR
jgi:murein DD-endopeptidase MepM/ murein hydrolase activator NlpD